MTKNRNKIFIAIAFLLIGTYVFVTIAPNNFRIKITEYRMSPILEVGIKKSEVEEYLKSQKIIYSEPPRWSYVGNVSCKDTKYTCLELVNEWHPSLLPGQVDIWLYFDAENKLAKHEMINVYDGL